MTDVRYDVWFDANEVDADGRVQVLRSWIRDSVQIRCGDVILAGDDEVEPIPAQVTAFNGDSGIITLRLLFDEEPPSTAVA